jgi:WD40 repeat protein
MASETEQFVSFSMIHPLDADVVCWTSGNCLNFSDGNFISVSSTIISVSQYIDGDKIYWLITTEDKHLYIYTSETSQTASSLMYSFPHKKKMTFTRMLSKDIVIFGDMFGEVVELDIKLNTQRNLFGHFAIITSAFMDKEMLITGDRDEKIRVSELPPHRQAISFCLGHRGYVSYVSRVFDRFVISCGSDGNIRLFDHQDGKQISHKHIVNGIFQSVVLLGDRLFFVTSENLHVIYSVKISEEGDISDKVVPVSVSDHCIQSFLVKGDGSFVTISTEGDCFMNRKCLKGVNENGKQCRFNWHKGSGEAEDEDGNDGDMDARKVARK